MGYLWLKAGGPANGFDGNADALTVGVNSLNTTYDFEPTELKATTADALICTGETTTVNLDLAGVANLYAYQFQVSYKSAHASASGAFVNSFFDTTGQFLNWNADCTTTPDECKFSVTKTGSALPVSGSGLLARITLTGTVPGTFSMVISDNTLTTKDGAVLPHNLGASLPITVCGKAICQRLCDAARPAR